MGAVRTGRLPNGRMPLPALTGYPTPERPSSAAATGGKSPLPSGHTQRRDFQFFHKDHNTVWSGKVYPLLRFSVRHKCKGTHGNGRSGYPVNTGRGRSGRYIRVSPEGTQSSREGTWGRSGKVYQVGPGRGIQSVREGTSGRFRKVHPGSQEGASDWSGKGPILEIRAVGRGGI